MLGWNTVSRLWKGDEGPKWYEAWGGVRADVFLGAQDPGDSPAGKPEALGETVDDEDVVLVDIIDILRSGDGGAVAVAGVVVARVELVADKGRVATAEILDLGQLRIGNDSTSGIAGVGSQDDRGAAGDFLGNLVGMDMVAIFFRERNRNRGEL